MNEQALQQFLEKLVSGTYTPEEYQAFMHWRENCSREAYESMLISCEEIITAQIPDQHIDPTFIAGIERGLDQLDEQENMPVIPVYHAARHSNQWLRMAAAVAIFILLSLGSYQYLHKNDAPGYVHDILPGKNQPFLTLSNGQKVIVSHNSGIIARQAGVSIQQDSTGQVSYSGHTKGADTLFNTLTNPRGGQVVTLMLPDGTIAKLDAASSITYPAAFTGKSRNVSTSGKVYFAVTHNKKQPFYVTTQGQITQDLGTRFVVEAYEDEPMIKTTLIEGSIMVSKNGQRTLLKPGQQTIATAGLLTRQADLEKESAWINGDFYFSRQDLHSVMRELSRIYDVRVTYQEDVENLVLEGIISRSHNLSAILGMIEATGKVHFNIREREVIVIAGTR